MLFFCLDSPNIFIFPQPPLDLTWPQSNTVHISKDKVLSFGEEKEAQSKKPASILCLQLEQYSFQNT